MCVGRCALTDAKVQKVVRLVYLLAAKGHYVSDLDTSK